MRGEGATEILYLTVDEVIHLHAGIFGVSVATAADQLRSRDGLAGALARPRFHAQYGAADLAQQAAALAHGIAEGQHFIDGNKRTALEALRAFLLLNGWQVQASQRERAEWILDLAQGRSVDELAEILRRSMTPG